MHYENAGVIFYGAIVALGLITAVILLKVMKYPGQKDGFELKKILPVIIVGAIIGAKIPVIMSYGWHRELFWTGKSYFGAIVGGFIAMNIYKAAAGISGNTGDRFVVPLCAAAAIGKVGCLVNGCCAGTPTDFIFKIRNHAGVFVHPVQIYETVFELLCCGFFIYLYKTGGQKRKLFILYLIMYSTFRFLIEFIRVEPRVLLGLTVYQWMSVIFIPIFLLALSRRAKNVY
jgi:prolipoprotein diacylglyceryltransferase